jgi:hypothetical protein
MGPINWRSKRAKIAASLIMILLVALSFGGAADKVGQ